MFPNAGSDVFLATYLHYLPSFSAASQLLVGVSFTYCHQTAQRTTRAISAATGGAATACSATRFQKGFEQRGRDEVPIRLGGIYAR